MSLFTPIPAIDAFVARLGARIHYIEGDSAWYRVGPDHIEVPPRGSRKTGTHYFFVLHEHAHWTGHPTRLARRFGQTSDDAWYAREELVAAAATLHLSFYFGLRGETLTSTLDYGKQFYERLKHDPAMIRAAFLDGRSAAIYLHECQGVPVPHLALSPWADKLLAEHFPVPPGAAPALPPAPSHHAEPILAALSVRERLAPLILRFGTGPRRGFA